MIKKETYVKRRFELVRLMKDDIVLLPTAEEHDRTPGIAFPFRPDSNFFYLSGFTETNAVIVLFGGKSILFCQEKNPETKIWTGDVLGPEGAVSELGFDEAYPIEKLDEKMLEFLKEVSGIFYPVARDETLAWDTRVLGWVRKSRTRDESSKPQAFDLSPLIAEMRLIKDAEEIAVMRLVAEISAEAHSGVMQSCGSITTEQKLETIFHKYCRDKSCATLNAYPTIVAGDDRACVLHYTKNNCILSSGELVLVDAGAELHGYAADITRTFPVNGKFTEPQKLLYQLVLDAQKAAIECICPGNTYQDPHIAAVHVIAEGLVRLGLLDGDIETLVQEKLATPGKGQVARLYPHRTSHWIGLDVHDVGDYKVGWEWRVLEPGMVLTVEPGIYVQPDDMSVDDKWRGIGIRIEDDILVTEDGYEILSSGAPKEIDAIENLVRK